MEGIGDVKVLIPVEALVDEPARNRVPHRRVRGGRFRLNAYQDRVAYGVPQRAIGRWRPSLAIIRGAREANGRIIRLLVHAARTMVLRLIEHNQVAGGKRRILYYRTRRGVVFIELSVVGRIARSESHGRLEHWRVVPERRRECESQQVRGLEHYCASTANGRARRSAGPKQQIWSGTGRGRKDGGVLVGKIEQIRRGCGVRPDWLLVRAHRKRTNLRMRGALGPDRGSGFENRKNERRRSTTQADGANLVIRHQGEIITAGRAGVSCRRCHLRVRRVRG